MEINIGMSEASRYEEYLAHGSQPVPAVRIEVCALSFREVDGQVLDEASPP